MLFTQEHRIMGATLGSETFSDFIFFRGPKWVWRVELIKAHLHMKFQRWKHFDLRTNVKVLARRGRQGFF